MMDRREFFSVAGVGVAGLLPSSVSGNSSSTGLPVFGSPRGPSEQAFDEAILGGMPLSAMRAWDEWKDGLWWKETGFSLCFYSYLLPLPRWMAEARPPTWSLHPIGATAHANFGEWLSSNITWYRWPQDRPIEVETSSVNPRFEGEVDTIWVPTFDMRVVNDGASKDKNIWRMIRDSLKSAAGFPDSSDYKHCVVFEIEGLQHEFGICSCSRPMQPVTNGWKNRDKATAFKLAQNYSRTVKEFLHLPKNFWAVSPSGQASAQ